MKDEDIIFKKNIEKLMKLSDTNDQPGEAFVEKLIDDAMVRLKTPRQNQQFMERKNIMKFSIKHTAALAAALVVIAAAITVIKAVPEKNNTETGPEIPIVAKAQTPHQNESFALKLLLPEPILDDTPKNLRGIENLEENPYAQRPVFMVPKGTVNAAAGKAVTCSDTYIDIEELKKITDGNKSGRDGNWVELGLDEQYVTIDLGGKYEIYAIVAWHYFQRMRVYYDVVVQVADDPDFIVNVYTLFNNDTDGSLGLGAGTDKNYIDTHKGKLIDAKGVRGRYVRMYSNTNDDNDLNHYIEVEVYGKPVSDLAGKTARSKFEKEDTVKLQLKEPENSMIYE